LSLEEFLPANLFAGMLIFARVGSALMLLPGFGEFYVLQRYRLMLALLLAALLTPVLGPSLPAQPAAPVAFVALVAGETAIGLFLGIISRVLLSALETAGTIASLQLGLSAAQIFNPMAAQPGTLTSSIYSVLGVLLIFLTDLHHLLLRALVDSYDTIQPGVMPQLGDVSELVSRGVGAAFRLGVELSAPFIVLGTVFFIAIGVVGRLVPQLQILFVTQPLQIIGGLLAFSFVLASGMHWFLQNFAEQFAALTGI
jgi:flagellar biosynthesis protein FliR